MIALLGLRPLGVEAAVGPLGAESRAAGDGAALHEQSLADAGGANATGDDFSSGSPGAPHLAPPLATGVAPLAAADDLQARLDAAQPGDVIEFSGRVSGPLFTKISGTALQPIVLRGLGDSALIEGAGIDQGFGLTLTHDHYVLENFRIRNFKKGLVGEDADHIIVRDVTVDGVGQEAFKLRKNSNYWLLASCVAKNTGLSGNYGEGFYIGDAASNWKTAPEPDRSGYVTLLDCYTTDTRNDGYDVKEGAHHVKFIRCVANFSGIEPAPNDPVGDSGWYVRSNDIQLIECTVEDLGNGGSAFKLFENTSAGGPYGRRLELKAVQGRNLAGALIRLHKSTVGDSTTLYDDFTLSDVAGGLYYSSTQAHVAPAAQFCEMTWDGIGGGKYYSGPSCQNEGSNQPPVAVAGASPRSGVAPLAVQFQASASSDPDGDPLGYSWVFGDGATATGVAPAHSFTRAGSYPVVLTVSDGRGGSDTAPLTITVSAPDGGGPGDGDGDGGGYEVEPVAGDFTLIAADDFESDDLLGGSGWSGPWSTGSPSDFSTDDEFARGDWSLNIRNTGAGERSLDLGGRADVRLEFYWVKESGAYDTGESLRLRVYDGAWHTLRTWLPGEASTTWQPIAFDLSSFKLGPGFKIRFENLANAASEEMFIDDLRIIEVDGGGEADGGYLAWALTHHGSAVVGDPAQEALVWGLAADPDADGANNFQEFAFGGKSGTADALPTLALEVNPAGHIAALSFVRRARSETELAYTVQVSADLATWTSSGPGEFERVVTDSDVLGDGAYERVSHRFLAPLAGPRVFLRVSLADSALLQTSSSRLR